MNRFSYLAAITAVNAASTGVKSNQLLLETGIGLTKNIRTFSYSNVATEWSTISDGAGTTGFETKISTGTGVANAFTLVKDEYFMVEINQALDGLVYVIDGTSTNGSDAAPIIVTGQFDTNVASSATALIANQYHIDATNIFGATNTGFIKNYLYPAFLFKCTNAADDKTTGFAVQGKVGTTLYYQSFKCTNKGTDRGSGVDANLLNHATLAELNADASNRLVASTIKDLSTGADTKLNKVTTTLPTTDGKWLEAGIIDNFGKKLAGEFFTVGANTVGISSKAAIMEV